jgi:[acyl-carrier-protein] S-malonyltransferase
MSAAAVGQKSESVALMFPGQGSQYPGMAVDLIRDYPVAGSLLKRADDVLGYSLTRIMSGERGDDLNRTIHTQPAVFVHSMAILEILKGSISLSPILAAGHSLGEYTALCAAGVMDFEDALDIIRVRAEGMDGSQPAGTCGMAAIIGISREQAAEITERFRGGLVLEAANFNASDQVVISGHIENLNRVVEALKQEKRVRTVMLPVSSAFHTSLMQPAREALRIRLESVTMKPPAFEVIANISARPYPASDSEVKQLLIDQVVNPVLWEDSIRAMLNSGAGTFIEIGPGKVLTGLLRRIDRTAVVVNISGIEDVRSFLESSL